MERLQSRSKKPPEDREDPARQAVSVLNGFLIYQILKRDATCLTKKKKKFENGKMKEIGENSRSVGRKEENMRIFLLTAAEKPDKILHILNRNKM